MIELTSATHEEIALAIAAASSESGEPVLVYAASAFTAVVSAIGKVEAADFLIADRMLNDVMFPSFKPVSAPVLVAILRV
jgi:hypothetical protein